MHTFTCSLTSLPHLRNRLLTGIEINSEADVLNALSKLHEMGASIVVITSCTLSEQDDVIMIYGSSNKEGSACKFKISVDRLPVCAEVVCAFICAENWEAQGG